MLLLVHVRPDVRKRRIAVASPGFAGRTSATGTRDGSRVQSLTRLLRRTPTSRRPLVAMVLVVLWGACSPPTERGTTLATVRDSLGVVIVESTGRDRPLEETPVRFEVLEHPNRSLEFVPWGIAVDPGAGLIYVADQLEAAVVVFDSSGAYVRQLGRRGEGPGEFLEPMAVAVDDDGVVSVFDARRGTVSRWSPSGSFIDESRLPVPYWGPGLAVADGWLALVASTTDRTKREQFLQVYQEGELDTVQVVTQELRTLATPCGSAIASPILAPTPVWASRGTTVYFAEGLSYRIDVHRSSGPLSSFRRALGPVDVGEEEARAFLETVPGPYQAMMRQCDMGAREVLASVGWMEEISPIMGIAVDLAGRLWVSRRMSSVTPSIVDVLAATGEYVGSFELPAVPIDFVSESRFVAVGLNPFTGGLTASLYNLREARADPIPAGSGEQRALQHPSADARDTGTPGSARMLEPSNDNPAGFREIRDCPQCPVMVILPSGRFTMGATSPQDDEGDPATRPDWTVLSEHPPTDVEISYPLAIGKYEVTFTEWDRCVETGWCDYRPDDLGWGRGHRPAIFISRFDAEHYIEWLRSLTGIAYRLPSEAEWEYAARAGTRTARWWGNALGTGFTVCDGCGSEWDDLSTAPVGSFSPNPWGLHDMLSNAREWVADCWVESHVGARTDGSSRTTESPWWREGRCLRALQRGSSWASYPWSVRAAQRIGGHYGPDSRSYSYGFRIVRPAEAHEVKGGTGELD